MEELASGRLEAEKAVGGKVLWHAKALTGVCMSWLHRREKVTTKWQLCDRQSA